MSTINKPITDELDAPPELPVPLTPEELDPYIKYRVTKDDDIYAGLRALHDVILDNLQHPWRLGPNLTRGNGGR